MNAERLKEIETKMRDMARQILTPNTPGGRLFTDAADAARELIAARERERVLREAGDALWTKIQQIHASPLYLSVWTSFMAHGGDYSKGLTYEKELEALEKVLSENEALTATGEEKV